MDKLISVWLNAVYQRFFDIRPVTKAFQGIIPSVSLPARQWRIHTMPTKTESEAREALRTIRNNVLHSSDPFRIIRDNEHGYEEHIRFVMDDISGYIEHCFDMGDPRPLGHLRRYFPKFTWEYAKPKSALVLLSYVDKSDYVWLANPAGDWSYGIVTATEIHEKQHLKICYCPNRVVGGVVDGRSNRGVWPAELREIGARLLVADIMNKRDYDLVPRM